MSPYPQPKDIPKTWDIIEPWIASKLGDITIPLDSWTHHQSFFLLQWLRLEVGTGLSLSACSMRVSSMVPHQLCYPGSEFGSGFDSVGSRSEQVHRSAILMLLCGHFNDMSFQGGDFTFILIVSIVPHQAHECVVYGVAGINGVVLLWIMDSFSW